VGGGFMISIKKNESFPAWLQVFAFGQFVDEVQGRAKALRLATRLAKENGQASVCLFGKMQKI
jgi:hypothetical protein